MSAEKFYECGLCNSLDFTGLFDKIDKYNQKVNLVICNKCGLLQLNPRKSEEDLNAFYESEYYNLYSMDDKKNNNPRWISRKEDMAARIINSITDRYSAEGKTLLDIGCGHGFLLKNALSKKLTAYGIEPSSKQANDLKKEGLNVINCDINSYENSAYRNLHPEKFDYITLSHVLEHISKPIPFLKNIRNILKEDGKFVLEVPNGEAPKKSPHNYPGGLHIAHINYFSPETLNSVLEISGFKVIFNESSQKVVRFVCERSEIKNFNELARKDIESLKKDIQAQIKKDNSFFKKLSTLLGKK